MANVLVIGGSRFMGRRLVWRLLAQGHAVTILNRGLHEDPFGSRVTRLRADRTAPEFRTVLRQRSFDAAVDFQAFSGADAAGAVEALSGQVGHYVMISSGQVYLVREAPPGGGRGPVAEEGYAGQLVAAPQEPGDRREWLYGVGKREAEDTLREAFTAHGFPYTALRLPMVEGEGDPSRRLESYLWRILDGGPLLLPDGGEQPVRHVYSGDVARAISDLLGRPQTFGEGYNLCQEEMPSLRRLLALLADLLGARPDLRSIPAVALEACGVRPEEISPFSTPWMSLLDPGKAQRDLGFRHEPLEVYLGRIVAAFLSEGPSEPPANYALRARELALATDGPADHPDVEV